MESRLLALEGHCQTGMLVLLKQHAAYAFCAFCTWTIHMITSFS